MNADKISRAAAAVRNLTNNCANEQEAIQFLEGVIKALQETVAMLNDMHDDERDC